MTRNRASLLVAAFALLSCESILPSEVNKDNCVMNPGICDSAGGQTCDMNLKRCVPRGGTCAGPVDCMMSTAAACSDGQCVPCTADNQCKAWSQARVLATPLDYCTGGTCGNCRTNADCATSAVGGLCDATTHLCRGCEANSECDSAVGAGDGICRRPGDYPETPMTGVETGKCVPSNLIAFATNKTVGPGCEGMSANGSTLSRPYCNLTIAAASGKPYIKVLPANHTALSLNGTSVNLVGPGRDAAQGAILAGLAVTGGTVSVSDMTVQASAGVVALQCRANATLYLNYSKVYSNNAFGVDAQQDCAKVFVDRTRIESTGSLAITVGEAGTTATTYRIVNSAVVQSGASDAANRNPVRLGDSASSGVFAYNTLSGTVGGVSCTKTTQSLTDSIISVGSGTPVAASCTQARLAIGTAELMAGTEPMLTTSAANTGCCIDKGVNPSGNLVVTDYFGTKRPVGGGFDIGFHEVK